MSAMAGINSSNSYSSRTEVMCRELETRLKAREANRKVKP
jgi:hypothetical protein